MAMKLFSDYTLAKTELRSHVTKKKFTEEDRSDLSSLLSIYDNHAIFICVVDVADNLVSTKLFSCSNGFEWKFSLKVDGIVENYSVPNTPDSLKRNGLKVAFLVCKAAITGRTTFAEFSETGQHDHNTKPYIVIDRELENLTV